MQKERSPQQNLEQAFNYKTKDELLLHLDSISPQKYARKRNFIGSHVTKLSPYITHGVITIPECVSLLSQKYSVQEAEKLLMELIRKEFFMQVQKSYGNSFCHTDIREDKTKTLKRQVLPHCFGSASTQTDRVNQSIKQMQSTGRLHNHQRMWLASRSCHRAKLGWKKCADRTYYHFIDGELSSNHLSRQWVNSTFSSKPYMMNEENLQKYWPGVIDADLRGSYDQVKEKIFDAKRASDYRKDKEHVLVHDKRQSLVDKLPSVDCGEIRILSPRRCDESLLADEMPTIMVIDDRFSQDHPRSSKRREFVLVYTQRHAIPLIQRNYQQVIQEYLDAGTKVILDERFDPWYRETQESYKNNSSVSFIPYDRVNKVQSDEAMMKFFKYRNKTKKYLKKV